MATKVIFSLSPEVVSDASGGVVLGEFNNWNYDNAINLKKQKDGSLKATAALEPGRTYQYRYFLNDGRWVNDARAERYVPADGFFVENCVITIPDETSVKEPKERKTPAKIKIQNASVVADDLTRIEGIGKKVNDLLAAENITSYKDLAKSSAKKLKAILQAAGSKFATHDPSSWPKQAKLAAAGKWEELTELQKSSGSK